MIRSLLCSLLVFATVAAHTAHAGFTSKTGRLYVGLGVGRANLSGTGVGETQSLGYGLDAKYRFNRSTEAGVLFQGHNEVDTSVLTTAASLEFHPLSSMSDLEFTIGLGPGLYTYTEYSALRVGLNFGAAIDLVLGDVHVGVGSRYHAILDPVSGGSFWNILFRLGYEFSLG